MHCRLFHVPTLYPKPTTQSKINYQHPSLNQKNQPQPALVHCLSSVVCLLSSPSVPSVAILLPLIFKNPCQSSVNPCLPFFNFFYFVPLPLRLLSSAPIIRVNLRKSQKSVVNLYLSASSAISAVKFFRISRFSLLTFPPLILA